MEKKAERIESIVNELAIELGLQKSFRVSVAVAGDYFRLEQEGEVIYADSACEELYDADCAEAMFCDYVRELARKE